MKTSTLALVATALFLVITLPASAQLQGCINSPENPTLILGLVGSVGAVLGTVRNRISARRANARNQK